MAPTSSFPPDLTPAILEPGGTELGALFAQLGAYNRAAVEAWSKSSFSLVLRNGAGTLVGGGHAEVLLGLAEIRAVWVEEARRGQGLGRALMGAIEAAAQERGARRAFLYTYSFQARGFYEGLGYRLLASLPFPEGDVERHYFTRDL